MVRCPSASYDSIKESLLFSFFSFFIFLFFFQANDEGFRMLAYICWTMVYSCPNLRFFIDFISFSALNCKICSALWAIDIIFWLIIPSSTWSHAETWTISFVSCHIQIHISRLPFFFLFILFYFCVWTIFTYIPIF